MAHSLDTLYTQIAAIERRCRCSKITIVEIDDVVIDPTQTNTMQVLSNGEVWFVACDGEAVAMDSADPVVVSADPNNDIIIGTDGGAFLDVSVFDTNFFVTNLSQNANRSHDQASFTTIIDNVADFIFRAPSGANTQFQLSESGINKAINLLADDNLIGVSNLGVFLNVLVGSQIDIADPSGDISINSIGNYILGDGAGGNLPATEAAPDWIALIDAATGRLEKITPAALGVVLGPGITFGADNQVPYTNATTNGFDYSPNFTMSGTTFSVDNSSVVFNESGVDVDFRIEGVGQPNAFFVDGTNGNVGIGTNSPDRLFHAELADALTNIVSYPLRLTHITSGVATTSFGIGQEWELENASGTNRIAATEEITWTDAVNATEDATYTLKLIRAGALTTALTVTSVGEATFANNVAGATILSSNGIYTFASHGRIRSQSDGVFTLFNNAQTDFNRLQFGGTTSAFPSLQRSGAGIRVRLADDSSNSTLTASQVILDNTISLEDSGTAPTAGTLVLIGGTLTVNTTAMTATAILSYNRKTSGGTIGTGVTYTQVNNTSFTLTSDNILDTSTFVWHIIETH